MSNNALTLTSKTAVKGNPTFAELMTRELRSLDWANGVEMQNRSKRPENIEKNTTRDFKPAQVEFLAAVAEVYMSFYVTRQMVVAVNMVQGHTSCPNYLNKNDFCRTMVRGLYKLPEWALPKDLVKKIRESMKKRAQEYREMKKAEAKKAKELEAAKAAEAKAEAKAKPETSEEKPAKTSKKKGAKASSKKKQQPSEVQPAGEPQDLVPPVDDANQTLAEVENNIEPVEDEEVEIVASEEETDETN